MVWKHISRGWSVAISLLIAIYLVVITGLSMSYFRYFIIHSVDLHTDLFVTVPYNLKVNNETAFQLLKNLIFRFQ